MFDWLFGKKKEPVLNQNPINDNTEAKRAFMCYHANENPTVCMCKPDCICFEGTCKDRVLHYQRIKGQLAYVHPPEDKCLMCNTKIKDAHWQYIWKGKQGFMCKGCGRDFHAIGYYLLDKAAQVLTEQNINVVDTKEKFGIMELRAAPRNEIESKIIKTLQERWQVVYSEFDWYFR